MNEGDLIHQRKKKVIDYLKKNTSIVAYALLAFVVFIAVRIRIANLPGLRDITTGQWTLGPDLDPFLFLRWAKYIVENGHLMVVDTMRYVPLGFDTSYELVLHVYLITWFHKIATLFGSANITESAVIYPVFMFGLGVIACFFMARKFFSNRLGMTQANAIALVSCLFLSIIPALLPRTIAGIPEKEASSLVFLFLAFYFFMCAWESHKKVSMYVYSALAGISTALMGLVWGGYVYILITIAPLVFLAFLLGKMNRDKKYLYAVWLIVTFAVLLLSTNRYSLIELLTSTVTLPCVFVFFLLVADTILFDTKLHTYLSKIKLGNFPRPVATLIIATVVGLVLASIVFGPSFILGKAATLKNFLVTTGVDRVGVTVAENRQPYFTEWAASFGPYVFNVPVIFWIFFFGAIYVFYGALHSFHNRDRAITTGAFALFLISVVFSRYSESSVFNGTNAMSLMLYALGPLVLLAALGFYYKKYHQTGQIERIHAIEFNYMFILCFFLISVLSARGGVRLIMMLVPSAAVLVGYMIVVFTTKSWQREKSNNRTFYLIISGILILITLFAAYQHYASSVATAEAYIPGAYNQQWQKAMAWVRENTPQDAVFGHWWDYGYWLQSIGERSTVLDGGNAKSYWNHLMGRYALTGSSNQDALEFLYAHNTTHFLIDSSDIGKYGAFSSIGSDKNYDRTSYIASFNKDPAQTQQRKNSSLFVYTGGVSLDDDLVYEMNGTRIFLPSGKAGLGAVLIEKSGNGTMGQPQGIFVYQGKQYLVPLRYLFNGKMTDFGTGIESGVYIMPRLGSTPNGIQIDTDGSLLYLSSRTVHSQFARLYLYGEDNSNFKLVHSEDDFLVAQVKAQIPDFQQDFVMYDAVRGPINIWEIHYPSNIQFKQEYLSEVWPPELLAP